MTQGQMDVIRKLIFTPLCMRLSRREREEVQRLGDMHPGTVLSVELAAWVERVYARAKKVSERGRR